MSERKWTADEIARLLDAYTKLYDFADQAAARCPFSSDWLAELEEKHPHPDTLKKIE